MRKTLLAVLAFAASSSVASAQVSSGTLSFKGDVAPNGTISSGGSNYAVGPYKADFSFSAPSLLTGSDALIWCVDFTHWAGGASDTYSATLLSGGTNFASTRAGSPALYKKAVWLIERYVENDAVYNAVNVQGTIWNIFGANLSGFTDLQTTQAFLNADFNGSTANTWYVLTDKLEGEEADNQEFLSSRPSPFIATPEPSTYALMGAGLLALGVASRRRRRTIA